MEPELLLYVATDGHELVDILSHSGNDDTRKRGCAGHQLATRGLRLIDRVLEVLEAERCLGRDLRREAVRRLRGEVRGVIEDLGAVRDAVAVQGVLVQRHDPRRNRLLIEPVVNVAPHDPPQREEARGPECGVDAAGESLHALGHEDIERLRRRQEAVAMVDARVREAQQAARRDAGGVVVVLRQAQVARHVPDIDAEVQQAARLVSQVGSQADVPEIVRAVHTLFPLEITRREERGLVVPAGRAQAVVLAAAGLERAVDLEGVEGLHRVDRANRVDRGDVEGTRIPGRETGAHGIADGREIGRPGGDLVDGTALHERRPPRGPRPTALGADLYDAIHGIGAVQRRRRRAFHDFDRLDLVRVQVVETRRGLTTDADGARAQHARRPVVHADTVDDHDGLISEREAARAADAHAAAGTRCTARRQHLDSRHAGVEEIGDVGRRRLLHGLGGIDSGDRVSEFPFQLLGAGTGHDHDIEGYRCRRKRKVEGRGFARPHRYRLRRGGVADESDLHIVATDGHTGDGVAAFAAGETLQVCADDQNLRPAHRLLVRFVRHLAGHAALLGGARARDTDQQRAKPQERE